LIIIINDLVVLARQTGLAVYGDGYEKFMPPSVFQAGEGIEN
jgi:hypothetical protein